MNYLQDKKKSKNNFKKYSFLLYGFIFLLIFFIFKTGFAKNFSTLAQKISTPFISTGNFFSNSFFKTKNLLISKNKLEKENEYLKSQIEELNAKLADRDLIFSENEYLKNSLGRKNPKNFLLSAVVVGPSSSIYDTFIIDTGEKDGVFIGQKVYTDFSIPIGVVEEVFKSSSRVKLYSSFGIQTNVIIKSENSNSSSLVLSGRGGGNFETTVPKDFIINNGESAVLPGLNQEIVAIAGSTISDPRDPINKILFISPINIFDIKFVELLK